MIFSKTLGYALQTVIYLGNQPPKKPILQKDISNDLDIPHHYLGKILQPLTKNGIVDSKTGATGGFFLTKSPNKIALNDIVTIFDGADCFEECILGFPGCGDETPCPVHSEWGAAKTILLKLIKDHSVAELGSEIGPKLDYIKMLKNSK